MKKSLPHDHTTLAACSPLSQERHRFFDNFDTSRGVTVIRRLVPVVATRPNTAAK
ncbi:MAG: hypothetical protein IPK98_19625 [Chloracidobacterium sp.]|nr:hypothetical protein [Chloracidobacterium sp.]